MVDRDTRRASNPLMFTHWEYLQPIRAYASFIVVFVLSASLTALALTYVYSEKYEATTTLIFSPEEITRLKFKSQESEAFGAPMPKADFKVIGKTLEELAKSERLLRRVVDELNLDQKEEKTYDGPWYTRYYALAKDYSKEYAIKAWTYLKYGRLPDKDPVVEAVLELAGNVTVTNNDSYVFFLTIKDKHPKRAALAVDTLATNLLLILNEEDTRSARHRRRQLETMITAKQNEINLYQAEITRLLSRHRITSASEEMDQALSQLYDLQSQRITLEAEIRQAKRKIASLDAKLSLKNTTPTDVTRRQATRGRGVSGRGGNSRSKQPRIQPEDFKKMASDKVFTEVELEGLTARLTSVQKSIDKLETWLKRLPELRLTIEQLETERSRMNEDVEMLSVALQELAVREITSLSELKIQHVATVPTAPVSPIKVYHVGLAAFLGTCVAVGLAYVLAFFNLRIFLPSKGVRGRRRPVAVEDQVRQEDTG